ncbi:MAG: O-antigen ligase family protein [Firmicutes bacterium]|nr:O-antigen ligase family protein [Bacillota bacterium]
METQSVVIRRLYIIAEYLFATFKNSIIYVLLKRLAEWFRWIFGSSILLEIIKRDSVIPKIWKSSKTYGLFASILHSSINLSRKLYEKRQNVFTGSCVYKFLIFAADNLHVLVSLSLFIMVITPHRFWYNIFTSMIAFGLLALLFIKTVTDKNSGLNFRYVSFYLTIFVISIFLAQIFSLFPSLSLRFLVFHLNCLVLVLILVNSINTKERLSTVVESILIGITFVGMYAIVQSIRGIPVNPAQTDLSLNPDMPGRVYSTMENPNNLGQVLIMLIPFYVAIILASNSFIKRFIIFGMGLPPLVALILTYSRSSWIGFVVAFFVFVLLINWRLVPLFVFAGFAMVPFLPRTVYNRILTIWDPRDSSVSYRFLIYKTIQPVFEDYWLTGTGLGSDVFMKVVQNYPLHTRVIPPHTHNLYIQVWIETGLIGALSFIGFLISTVKKGIKTIKMQSDKYIKYNIIAGISSLAGILTVGAAEYVWYYPRVMVIFWVVIGLLLASINLTENRIDA